MKTAGLQSDSDSNTLQSDSDSNTLNPHTLIS
jgi:hypothetical protein